MVYENVQQANKKNLRIYSPCTCQHFQLSKNKINRKVCYALVNYSIFELKNSSRSLKHFIIKSIVQLTQLSNHNIITLH